jgi:hypothetical protein
MSIRFGSWSNGRTFGPTATIVPSGRWSPLIQSASSSAVFACVSEYPTSGSIRMSGAESAYLPLKTSSRL